jgi:hypothetical protein
VFLKLSELIREINQDIAPFGLRFEEREEYAVEYVEQLLSNYKAIMNLNPAEFITGRGHRKTPEQRIFQQIDSYLERLKRYAMSIEICGEERNSYSKTDHDAAFMRVKNDYMGNGQLLPSYNMQIGICDEYIAVVDAKQYASDMECFAPLMDKFSSIYGHYPKYPVADAGYGSYNNYLYCHEKGMEKFMKFTMFEKETKSEEYRTNPYRAVNFTQDAEGNPICPNGRKFIHKLTRHVRGNQYGRTEEIYECESCEGCPHKEKCCPRAKGNRSIRMNQELTAIHQEVVNNLQTVHGALLCMNRSIEAEGTFGVMKWDRSYERACRRGIKNVNLEFHLIACGFNLYKYHNRRQKRNTEDTENPAA